MCGRYRLTAKERWLSEYFSIPAEDINWATRWNIAPTDEVATIRQDKHSPKRIFAKMRWGLVPSIQKLERYPLILVPIAAGFLAGFASFAKFRRMKRTLLESSSESTTRG